MSKKALVPLGLIAAAGVMGSLANGQGNKRASTRRGMGRRGVKYDSAANEAWVAFFSADTPTPEGMRLGRKFRDRIEYLVDNKFNLPDDAEYPDLNDLAYLSYASHAGHGVGLWEDRAPWHSSFEKVVMADKQARDLGYRLDEEIYEGTAGVMFSRGNGQGNKRAKTNKRFAPGETLLLDSPHSRGLFPPTKVNFRGYYGAEDAVVVQDGRQMTTKVAWLSRIKGQRDKINYRRKHKARSYRHRDTVRAKLLQDKANTKRRREDRKSKGLRAPSNTPVKKPLTYGYVSEMQVLESLHLQALETCDQTYADYAPPEVLRGLERKGYITQDRGTAGWGDWSLTSKGLKWADKKRGLDGKRGRRAKSSEEVLRSSFGAGRDGTR